MQNSHIKVVTIGGGTGSFTILSGLKQYTDNITALVGMADDGGSTGVLVDEYGVLPPGDIRQCLVALAREPRVRELFQYRFEDGTLDGHSFGNLFLAATEKLTGDFRSGVDLASRVLNIVGHIEPLTLERPTLILNDGAKTMRGEHIIDEGEFRQRPTIQLEPQPTLNPAATQAIKDADLIIIAPGSLYTSLGAALTTPGLGSLLARVQAPVFYVCNLVNKPGQTDGFTVRDYADEIERFAGGKIIDAVFYNSTRPSPTQFARYQRDNELLVEYGGETDREYIPGDFISRRPVAKSASDRVVRSLIRHDPHKIAQAILEYANPSLTQSHKMC